MHSFLPLIILSLGLFAFIAWHRLTYAFALFCFLLPTYLIRFSIGPIPSTFLEGMLWILSIITLIHHSRSKEERRLTTTRVISLVQHHRSLLLASTLFLLAATIAVFASSHTRAALGEWKAFYVEPILFCFLLFVTIRTKKDVYLLISALLLSGFLTSSFAIYQHFTGFMVPYAFWENRHTYRVTAWYGFPNAVGLFLAPLFPLAILFLTQWKKQIPSAYRVLSLLFLPTALLAILYAKSTGALMGVVASTGLLSLWWKKTRWPALVLGVFGIGILCFLPPHHPIRQELFMQDRSGQIRIDMWGETVEYLFAHPIFGAGLASYRTEIYPYRIDKWIEVFHHPHNIFLTMWVNLGILGLISFTWMLVWFTRTAYHVRQHPMVPFVFASMGSLLTTGLVDSPYIKNDLSILFWILPALLLILSLIPSNDSV